MRRGGVRAALAHEWGKASESTVDRKSPEVALTGTRASLRACLRQASLARKSSRCLARPLAVTTKSN